MRWCFSISAPIGRGSSPDVIEIDAASHTGVDEIRLRPGLGWHPRPGIDVSLTVDIPVYQDYDGEQLAVDFRTFFAVGVRF